MVRTQAGERKGRGDAGGADNAGGEPPGKLTAGSHAGRSRAPGVLLQVPGGVSERVLRGQAGLAPCGQRRAGTGPHAARNRGDVLGGSSSVIVGGGLTGMLSPRT
jgi:hypothetical protein